MVRSKYNIWEQTHEERFNYIIQLEDHEGERVGVEVFRLYDDEDNSWSEWYLRVTSNYLDTDTYKESVLKKMSGLISKVKRLSELRR